MQTPRNGRPAAMYSLMGRTRSAATQVGHGVRRRADAREHDGAGGGDGCRVIADERVGADVSERARDAAEVPGAVIDDHNADLSIWRAPV